MIETLLYDRVETIEPQGYVNAANASDFLERLKWAIESKQDCVFLVDMKEVEFLDSAGLMALIKGFRLAQSLGKSLSICSIPPSVRMIFELTQLDTVFEIFENREKFEMVRGSNSN
ncbi:MAG: STAS domain-containing protein [Xenococcaceae cyanobacterium]